MRVLFLILAVLLLASPGRGATVYAKDISGTVYYESGASSCADVTNADTSGDLAAALTAAGASGTLYICAGTYSGTEIDAADGIDSTANGQTIEGVGTVTLSDCAGTDNTIYASHSNITIKNLTISNSDSGKYAIYIVGTGTETLQDLIISGGGGGGIKCNNNSGTITLNRVLLEDKPSQPLAIGSGAGDTADYVLNYVRVEHGSSGPYITECNSVTINNSIIIGSGIYGMKTTNHPGDVTLNNCIISSIGQGDATSYTIEHTGSGTFTANNCLLLPNPLAADSRFISGTVTQNNCQYVTPQFMSNRREGFLILCIDDKANIGHWGDVVAVLNEYGFNGVYAVDYPYNLTAGQWATLQTHVDNGHEIASHTRHHVLLGDRGALDIQYTGGAAACTMTIASEQLSTTTTGGVDDIAAIDLTGDANNKISELVATLNGTANYTCTIEDAYQASAQSNDLADITDQDIKTASYEAQFDETRYFAEEVTTAKSDIESGLTNYTCKTMVYPYGNEDEAAQDAVKNAGFIDGAATTSGDRDLGDLEIFNIYRASFASLIGTTNIARNTAALCEYIQEYGLVIGLVGHTAATFSLANWRTMLAEVAKSNVRVMTLAEACEHIDGTRTGYLPTGTDADADGERWTRTFTDGSDYTLQPTSRILDDGVDVYGASRTDYTDVTKVTDQHGNPTWGGGVDIGVYESESKEFGWSGYEGRWSERDKTQAWSGRNM